LRRTNDGVRESIVRALKVLTSPFWFPVWLIWKGVIIAIKAAVVALLLCGLVVLLWW
jgi:hypothetical protein